MNFAPPPAVAENRCTFRVTTTASYRYAQPARRVTTCLRLVPPDARGRQRLGEREVQVAPLPYENVESADEWGNRVIELRNEAVREHLTIAARFTVETAGRFDESGRPLPAPIPSADPDADAARYLPFTDRTDPDADLDHTARDLCRWTDPARDPFAFVACLRARVHAEMTFQAGATDVGTPAARAWAGRRGVCQDYAQIALALCRLAGIPARYVSGYVPGEGVMHAWAEALLTARDGSRAWYPFDPTYDKWVDEKYIAAAVGRDYADATPTSGTYYGGASTLRYASRVEVVRKDLVLL